MRRVSLNIAQLVSGAVLAAAVGGGIVYQVLVSNTVTCLVEAPKAAQTQTPPPPQPFLDMTHGKRF